MEHRIKVNVRVRVGVRVRGRARHLSGTPRYAMLESSLLLTPVTVSGPSAVSDTHAWRAA